LILISFKASMRSEQAELAYWTASVCLDIDESIAQIFSLVQARWISDRSHYSSSSSDFSMYRYATFGFLILL
jgi:hypothetical protein